MDHQSECINSQDQEELLSPSRTGGGAASPMDRSLWRINMSNIQMVESPKDSSLASCVSKRCFSMLIFIYLLFVYVAFHLAKEREEKN